jgi:hypothetical protein
VRVLLRATLDPRFKCHIRKTRDSHFWMLCSLAKAQSLPILTSDLTRPSRAWLKPTTSRMLGESTVTRLPQLGYKQDVFLHFIDEMTKIRNSNQSHKSPTGNTNQRMKFIKFSYCNLFFKTIQKQCSAAFKKNVIWRPNSVRFRPKIVRISVFVTQGFIHRPTFAKLHSLWYLDV